MPCHNEELILAVLHNLRSKLADGRRISITTALFDLRDIIVEEYAVGSSLQTYKGIWVTRIKETALRHNFEMSARPPSWIRLDPLLLNKNSENTVASTTTPSRTPSTPARRTNSTAAVSSSNTALSYTLTTEDKKSVKEMYQKLDTSKMWKLSTGTIVEKQMEELANKCIVEHPCHSLILDTEDETWKDYFTEEELDEIRDHKVVDFTPSSSELKEYLDSLVQKDDENVMHEDISQTYYKPRENPACYWAQKTLLEGLDLHNSVLDFSSIIAREEIYSAACSVEMNKSRRLGSTAALAKKRLSKRPDHLYSFNEYELGVI